MARLRTRAKRSFLLAVAIAFLALLLEMNRFIPGTWRGGDGGGMRFSSELGPRSDGDAPEREEPNASEHPEAVVPPEETPTDWPPKMGMWIELRGPRGDLQTDWWLGVGAGGDESGRPDDDGSLRMRDSRLHEEGFRIRTKAGLVRHRQGVNDPAGRWAVYLPEVPLPRQRHPGAVTMAVVDAATGKPIPDARVTWRTDDAEWQEAEADASGVASVGAARPGGPFQVFVTALGHAPKNTWVGPRDPRAVPVALDRLVGVKLRVVGDGSETPAVRDGFVLAADGRELAHFKGDTPTLTLRESETRDAWLELHVVVDPERRVIFTFRRRLDPERPTVRVPESRILEVSVRNPHGAPVSKARVSAIFGAEADAHTEGEPVRTPDEISTGADGRALVAVPARSAFTLLIEPPAGAPIARRYSAGDGNAPLEVITQAGLVVPVLVRGASGGPLAGVRVVARASLGDLRVLRRATTGPDGRAGVGPLGEGPVEIFAGAPGHAWSAAVEIASGAMGTVELRLRRGHPLSLVVEDAFGLPLAGVGVEVSPADGGRPLTAQPDGRAWRTDVRGRLTVPDLPLRSYDVTLTLPEYGVEKLRKVKPGSVTYFGTLVRTR